MCTVTYIPLSKNEFYLTSNRDEKSTRAEAIPPKKYKINNTAVYFPKDPQAGGTWIAASEKKYTLCLLNGANKNHIKKESYRLSRGQMLLDFFNYNDAIHFKQNYNFNKIEPFTLLIICTTNEICFYELQWDGVKSTLKHIDENKPNIWSSATLYSKETIENRKEWFSAFLNTKKTITKDDIINFHKFGGNGDSENDLFMNRNNITRTVSITMIHRSYEGIYMNYSNVLKNETDKIRIIK